MTTTDRERFLHLLKVEYAAWLQEIKRFEERIEARRRLIDALEKDAALSPLRLPVEDEANGDKPHELTYAAISEAPRPKPSTGTAIQLVLSDQDRPLWPRDILEALEDRDWAPSGKNPLASVSSSLWYLGKKGSVQKTDSGWVAMTSGPDTGKSPFFVRTMKDLKQPEADTKGVSAKTDTP